MTKLCKLDLNIGDEIRLTVAAPEPLDPRYRVVVKAMMQAMDAPAAHIQEERAAPVYGSPEIIAARDQWIPSELWVLQGKYADQNEAISAYRKAFPHSQRTDKAISVRYAVLQPDRSKDAGYIRDRIPSHNDTSWIVPDTMEISDRTRWSEAEDEVIRRAGCVAYARTNYRLAYLNSNRIDKAISVRYDRLRRMAGTVAPENPIPEPEIVPKPEQRQEPVSTGAEVTLHDPIPEPEPEPEPETPVPALAVTPKPRKDGWAEEEDNLIRDALSPQEAITTHRQAYGRLRTDGAIQARYKKLNRDRDSAPPADEDTIQVPAPKPETQAAAPEAPVSLDPHNLPDALLRHLLVSTSAEDAADRYRQQYRGAKPYKTQDIITIFRSLSMPIRIGVSVETRAGVGKITRINRDGNPTVIIDCKKMGKIVLDPVNIYRENRILRPQLPEIQDDPSGLSSPLSSQVAA